MYPINNGGTFLVQQAVPAGVFDGTEVGRAGLAFDGPAAPDSRVLVRARRYGTAANAYGVVLADPGTTGTTLRVEQAGTTITVRLVRTGGGISTTAAEVAAAINAKARATPGFPLVADADPNGTGAGVVAAAPLTPLTGGLDPGTWDDVRGHYKWTFAGNGGLFYFEQEEAVFLRQVHVNLTIAPGASHVVRLWIVNLTPGLAPIPGERGPLIEGVTCTDTSPAFGVTDVRAPVLPGQALLVEADAPGIVTCYVRREARFPYA
jgi:hypothetical protein